MGQLSSFHFSIVDDIADEKVTDIYNRMKKLRRRVLSSFRKFERFGTADSRSPKPIEYFGIQFNNILYIIMGMRFI